MMGPRPGTYDANALGRRELEAFRLVGLGMTNAEIAEAMGISPTTVRTYMKRIHDKLYIVGRSRLAVESHKHFAKEESNGL